MVAETMGLTVVLVTQVQTGTLALKVVMEAGITMVALERLAMLVLTEAKGQTAQALQQKPRQSWEPRRRWKRRNRCYKRWCWGRGSVYLGWQSRLSRFSRCARGYDCLCRPSHKNYTSPASHCADSCLWHRNDNYLRETMIFGNPKVTFTTYPDLYGVILSQYRALHVALTGLRS